MAPVCASLRGGLFGIACLALGACSSVPYAPRPIDADASAAEYRARSAQADGLKAFAVANGYAGADWPPAQWGLKELTLAAWYFHADMRDARARAKVARAQQGAAGTRRSWFGRLKPERHSRAPADGDSPWSLGLELEIPLVAPGRRAALAERNAFLASAAEIDVAQAAWEVRARVRDSHDELQASRSAIQTFDAQIEERKNIIAMVNRRVDVGILSARELGTERYLFAQLVNLRDQQLGAYQRAQGNLAAALGLPLDALTGVNLRPPAEAMPDTDLAADALRRQALRNRLDVHRKLLEFGAADAEVKQAVAAQNPEITLGPGYAWDQGDNIWSLALGLSLPPAAQAQAAIREALARRELAAEQFAATQIAAIQRAEGAGAQYQLARERIASAQLQMREQQEQEARVLRQFDAGAADRLQRVVARIDALTAHMQYQSVLADARQALAQLEDALQRPLLGDFEVLPEIGESPSRSENKANVEP